MKKLFPLLLLSLVSCGEPFFDHDITQTARPILNAGTYEVWRGGPDLADGVNPPVTPSVADGHSNNSWGTGTATSLYIGSSSPTSAAYRGVIRWDLGFVPPNAVVTSAAMSIYFERSNQQQTVTVHEVTSPWTETSNAPEWTTYDATVLGSFTTNTWSGTRTVDITALVQSWVSGTPNYGVLLEQPPGGGSTNVHSSERATASQRPKLTISYTTPPPAPPDAPVGLAAEPGDTIVGLSWAATSGASSYSVYRDSSEIVSGLTSINYLDTGLTNGVEYVYAVSASNAAGESLLSSTVSATPTEPPPPPAPTWVSVTPDDTFVQLEWTASAGATSYDLARSTTAGGPYTTIASPTITEYTDAGLANGTMYYYVVSAVSSSGTSAPSTETSATPAPPPPPSSPTNVIANAGDAEIALSWSASPGATSYTAKRSLSVGGPYTDIANVTVTNYTDTGLNNGTTYYYVVSAENTGGESPDSSEVVATPQELPPPSTIRIAVIGDYGSWGGGSTPDSNAQSIANLVASWAPDFVLTGGDNVYDSASDAYPRIVGHYYGDYVANQTFFPIMGNHDWDYGHQAEYFDYFNYLPGNRRYYEKVLDANDIVRMFAVVTDWREPDGVSETSVQGTWLQNRLALSSSCFDLVLMHDPGVSSSIGGSGPAWGLDWPFAAWGAEAVIQAHVHAYERLSVNGIPYFVNGTGGGYLALSWGSWTPVPESQFRLNTLHYGAQLITISIGTPTTLTAEFYAIMNGVPTLVDSVVVSKQC